mmetsp:Transcript_13322/g.18200  ORF Transcript_13322/g.18200 Transcript_13322/m.18200 type:complete len:116 (-) Transcript_13322:105-452(-)
MTTKGKSTFTTPKPGKSALGQQVDSRKRTESGYSFGRATREKITGHTFMSEEHARRGQMECKDTPAAIYTVPSSLGKQTLKGKRNCPITVVGKTQRFAEIPDYTPLQTPGPGAYE